MRRLLLLMVLACGCADGPTSVIPVAGFDLKDNPASVALHSSKRFIAIPVGPDGRPLFDRQIIWTSSDTSVATVSPDGVVYGAGLGTTYITARYSSIVDSTRLTVDTDCSFYAYNTLTNSSFRGILAHAGVIGPPEVTPSLLNFHGTPFFHSSGILFGTGPSTTVVSETYLTRPFDIAGQSCPLEGDVDDFQDTSPVQHWISWLQPANPRAPWIAGLTVIQEQFAFNNTDDADYILEKFTFRNDSSAAIQHVTVGTYVDFDILTPSSKNVAAYDTALNAATVISNDSTGLSVTAGFAMVGNPVISYKSDFAFGMPSGNADHFNYLIAGFVGPNPTAPGDAHQMIAVAPFDLAPRESKAVWYILAVGANRTGFERSMRRGIAVTELLTPNKPGQLVVH